MALEATRNGLLKYNVLPLFLLLWDDIFFCYFVADWLVSGVRKKDTMSGLG